MATQTEIQKEPLAIQVVCKHCNLQQEYRGQIRCIHCEKQGSLQLVLQKGVNHDANREE